MVASGSLMNHYSSDRKTLHARSHDGSVIDVQSLAMVTIDVALDETNWSYDTKSLSATQQTDTEGIPERCCCGEGMERVWTHPSTLPMGVCAEKGVERRNGKHRLYRY